MGGWVEGRDQERIYSNPIFFNASNIYRLIPHEFLHTRQHREENDGWTRLDGNVLEFIGPDEVSKWKNFKLKAVRAFQDIKGILSTLNTVSGYYARNSEMQAGLHEVIAAGYAAWQKMPTSKQELWAALYSMGCKVPQNVSDYLFSTEGGKNLIREFAVPEGIRNAVARQVGTFNSIYNYAGDKRIREALWDRHLPFLYGNMLELYGDVPGRERMGLGTNPRPAIELIALMNGKEESQHTQALYYAQNLPPELSACVLNYIVGRGERDVSKSMQVAETLLKRPEVRDWLFREDARVEIMADIESAPPLYTALMSCHRPMIELLMRHGADPFQTFKCVDYRGDVAYVNYSASMAGYCKNMQEILGDKPKPESAIIFENYLEVVRALNTLAECAGDHLYRERILNFSEGFQEITTLAKELEKAGIDIKHLNLEQKKETTAPNSCEPTVV